jgi:hypothetical protein
MMNQDLGKQATQPDVDQKSGTEVNIAEVPEEAKTTENGAESNCASRCEAETAVLKQTHEGSDSTSGSAKLSKKPASSEKKPFETSPVYRDLYESQPEDPKTWNLSNLHHGYPMVRARNPAEMKHLPDLIRLFGVVVIRDVFLREECVKVMDNLLGDIEKVCDKVHVRKEIPGSKSSASTQSHLLTENATPNGVDELRFLPSPTKGSDEKTFTWDNLTNMRRFGLFQTVFNNSLKAVWSVRRDPKIAKVFGFVLSSLKEKKELKSASAYRDYLEEQGYTILSDTDKMEDDEGNMVDPDAEELLKRRMDRSRLVTSLDGINLQPPAGDPRATRSQQAPKDWAHLDQTICGDSGTSEFQGTIYGNLFRSIQGQVVLSESDACFVATPGSHLYFEEIMDISLIKKPSPGEGCYSQTNATNWKKFDEVEIRKIKEEHLQNENVDHEAYAEFEEGTEQFEIQNLRRQLRTERSLKLNWQIPIRAPPGALILWTSTTIHSARGAEVATPKSDMDKIDPYRGWRGVIYTCLRPKDEFNPRELASIEEARKQNVGTNHWGRPTAGGQVETQAAANQVIASGLTLAGHDRAGGTSRASTGSTSSGVTISLANLNQTPNLAYKKIGWTPAPGSYLIE